MKIFAVDTDETALSALAQSLAVAGFLCEPQVFSKESIAFLGKAAGQEKGVLVLGPEMPGPLKRRCFRLQKTAFPMPVLFILKKDEKALLYDRKIVSQPEWGDFVCMPYRPWELHFRVGMLLRRRYPAAYNAYILRKGPFVLSRFPNCVRRNGKEIVLTPKEFELAYFLFQNFGQPLSRLTIEETMWPSGDELSRTVDTHISRIRNKLKLKSGSGFILQQIYGYGYQLAAEEAVMPAG